MTSIDESLALVVGRMVVHAYRCYPWPVFLPNLKQCASDHCFGMMARWSISHARKAGKEGEEGGRGQSGKLSSVVQSDTKNDGVDARRGMGILLEKRSWTRGINEWVLWNMRAHCICSSFCIDLLKMGGLLLVSKKRAFACFQKKNITVCNKLTAPSNTSALLSIFYPIQWYDWNLYTLACTSSTCWSADFFVVSLLLL